MTTTEDNLLQAAAFRRLYPEQFYDKFVSQGIRPDGRPLATCRAATIGLGPISSADASALVKIGNSSVLAGLKYEIEHSKDASNSSPLRFKVELSPFYCPEYSQKNRNPELVGSITERVRHAFVSSGVLGPDQLSLAGGKARWVIDVSLYVLENDGGVLDAAILATVAALLSSEVPASKLSKDGRVLRATGDAPASAGSGSGEAAKPLELGSLPLGLSFAMYKEALLVDPVLEEEDLADGAVSVVIDGDKNIYGLFKTGAQVADSELLLKCVEAARRRHSELSMLLRQAVEEHRAEDDEDDE